MYLFALACGRSGRPSGGPRRPPDGPRRALTDLPGGPGAPGAGPKNLKTNTFLARYYGRILDLSFGSRTEHGDGPGAKFGRPPAKNARNTQVPCGAGVRGYPGPGQAAVPMRPLCPRTALWNRYDRNGRHRRVPNEQWDLSRLMDSMDRRDDRSGRICSY